MSSETSEIEMPAIPLRSEQPPVTSLATGGQCCTTARPLRAHH